MEILRLVLSAVVLLQGVVHVVADEKCSIDVIAVLDGSDSISDDQFHTLKGAVTQLARWLNKGDNSQRLGTVVYSSTVTDSVPLSSGIDVLKQKISAFVHPMDGTATHLGILKMIDMFNDEGRDGVPQVGIVITDGRSKDTEATQKAATQAKADGVRMIAVGIGHKVNRTELASIASNQGDVKTIGNFDDLQPLLAQLVKEFCIVDGEWSEWNVSVSDCSVTCDPGTKTHTYTRTCTNPAPRNGGKNCPGSPVFTNTTQCLVRYCPVNGGWSGWTRSSEGQCSATCGGGVKTKTFVRSCTNPIPKYGGAGCSGSRTKQTTESCNSQDCVDNPCAGCRYENGVGYMPHPSDCRFFFQCLKFNNSYFVMPCPPGVYWSQEHLTCTRSRENCSPDIPIYIPTPESEDDDVDKCDGSTRPVSHDKSVYKENVPGLGWITRNCPPGTGYTPDTCTCENGGTVTKTGCTPELYIPFRGDVTDRSGKNVVVDNLGVKVTSKDQGLFVDNTGLRVNRFSNMDFGSTMIIDFKMSNTENRSVRGQAVVTNAQCEEAGTFYILSRGRTVEFKVFNTTMTPHVLFVNYPDRGDALHHVALKVAGGKMYATVDGETKTTNFKGDIAKAHCALHIGQGTGFDNFLGLIDELRVYVCEP